MSPGVEGRRPEEEGGEGEDQELVSPTRSRDGDSAPLLEEEETRPMISHAAEDHDSPLGSTCEIKGINMRDKVDTYSSESATLTMFTGSQSDYARRRQRKWMIKVAVFIGSLGVGLLPFSFSSVRKHMAVSQGSPPPVVAPVSSPPPPLVSNVLCPPKLEPLHMWNMAELVHRPMECVAKDKFYSGRWVHAPYKSRPELLYQVVDVGGTETEFRKGDLTCRADVMLPYNQYDWVPNDPDCPLLEWSIPGVCRLLERTNVTSILFVGDSITYQYAQSLYKMGGGLYDLPQFDPTWGSDICSGVLPEPVKIRYLRNDILYTGTRPDPQHEWDLDFPETIGEERRGVDIVYPWTHLLKDTQVDLLFVNAGTHIHNFKFYKLVIHRAAEYLKNNYQGKLVFRTSVPGHSQCNSWARPLETEKEFVDYNEEELTKFTWPYLEWYNAYAVDLFESIGAEIAYADRILKLRADGHLQGLDCLHYHLPGPPDWGTKVWYNVWLTKYAKLLD